MPAKIFIKKFLTLDLSWMDFRDSTVSYIYICIFELKIHSIYQLLNRIYEPKQVNKSILSLLMTDYGVDLPYFIDARFWSLLSWFHFLPTIKSILVYINLVLN